MNTFSAAVVAKVPDLHQTLLLPKLLSVRGTKHFLLLADELRGYDNNWHSALKSDQRLEHETGGLDLERNSLRHRLQVLMTANRMRR